MANHKSAIKKYKRDEKKRLINKMNKSKMKNQIKKFKKDIEAGNMKEAEKLFPADIYETGIPSNLILQTHKISDHFTKEIKRAETNEVAG